MRYDNYKFAVTRAMQVVALLVLLINNGLCVAQTPSAGHSDKAGQDGIIFELSCSSKELSIADTFDLTLTVTYPAGITAILPKLDAVLKDNDNFGLLNAEKMKVQTVNGGDKASITYRVEPRNTGQLALPDLILEYYKGKTGDNAPEIKTLKLNGPIINVTDIVPTDGEGKLNENKGQVELPVDRTWLIWVAVGVFLTIIALLVIVYVISKRQLTAPALPQRPAHEIALERLNALIAENLLHAGRVKEFYEKLSYIIRLYIEHRYALKAPEMTTEEFLQEATRSGEMPEEFKGKLSEFLMHCDMVKFAKYAPTADEIDRSVLLARNFIESTAALG